MKFWKNLAKDQFFAKSSAFSVWGGRAVGIRSALLSGLENDRSMAWETLDFQGTLCLRDRVVWHPLLPRDLTSEEGNEITARLLKFCSPAFMVIGVQEWTARLEGCLTNCRPTHRVHYIWMERPLEPVPQREPDPQLEVHWAGPRDAVRLFGLQEAYEKEEVLSDPSDFHSFSSFLHFRKQLESQLNAVVDHKGIPVAKAGTNALVEDWAQLGGVFTRPDRRGQGLQKRLLTFLLDQLWKMGRSACLFVKKNNQAALKLYQGLGFQALEDFEISYWKKGR
ncbi:MAG: GNAT family N-acetyltransferase [Spirochaetales bacterium]|nr:GNAT family N-acetyltransferase [Spirochaetales bacterium]